MFSDPNQRVYGEARHELIRMLDEAQSFANLRPDELAETDWHAGEAWQESAHGTKAINTLLDEKFVNPNDWYRFTREADPKRLASRIASEAGYRLPDSRRDSAEIVAGVQAWQDELSRGLGAELDTTWSDPRQMARSLERHHGASLSSVGLRAGLRYDNHAQAYSQLMASATDSLDVGLFMNEHAVTASEIVRTLDRLGTARVNVRVNATFNEVGRQMGRMFSGLLGETYSQSEAQVTDHFKYMAANLGGLDDNRASLVIGSINATGAALGTSGLSGQQALRGSNVESHFVVMREGFASDAAYSRLVGQMRAMSHSVHSGALDATQAAIRARYRAGQSAEDAIRDTFKEWDTDQARREAALGELSSDGFSLNRSQLLTGAGLRAAHEKMLGLMGSGDSATIVTYNVGSDFLERVRGALTAGGRVSLMTGSRYDFTENPKLRSAGIEPLAHLDAFVSSLSADERGRFDVVVNEQELVHAKVSMFNVAGRDYGIAGTMNLDNRQYAGAKVEHGTLHQYRNFGVFLSSGDYDAARLASEHQMTRDVVTQARLLGTYRAGTSAIGSAVREQLRGLVGQYGLKTNAVDFVQDPRDENQASKVVFRIGGNFDIRIGHKSYSFDVGTLNTLTAYQDNRGFGNQVFVSELSKFIGDAYGAVLPNAQEQRDGTFAGMAPRTVGAWEVLAAGTAGMNREIEAQLTKLVHTQGYARAKAMMVNAYDRGVFFQKIRQQTRQTFENFAGLEAGVPIHGSKQFARLGFKLDASGNLDVTSKPSITAPTLDAILSGKMQGNISSEHFVAMSGGLSRETKDKTSAARFYDLRAIAGGHSPFMIRKEREDGNDAYMFLLPLSKIAQLPQRLQTLFSARQLTVMSEAQQGEVLRALGKDPSKALVRESLLADATGHRSRGLMIRGLAVSGFAADNALMVADQFQDTVVMDESFTRTLKIQRGQAVGHAPGADFVNAVKNGISYTAADGTTQLIKATALSDGRFMFTAEQLAALEHKIQVSRSVVPGTHMEIEQLLSLKTENHGGMGLILDMKEGRGISMSVNGGSYEIVIKGQSFRQLGTGDRSMHGLKVPYAMVTERSRAIGLVNAALESVDSEMARQLGYIGADGRARTNAVFGMGVIKTGVPLLETGLEVLKSGAWRKQIAYAKASGSLTELTKFADMVEKIGSMSSENARVRESFKQTSELLRELASGASSADGLHNKLYEMLRTSEKAINRQGSVKVTQTRHVMAAALAMGLHANYYIGNTTAEHRMFLRDAFDSPRPQGLNDPFDLDRLNDQFFTSVVPIMTISQASAMATPLSNRQMVNFLNYHSGGYTDAFMDLMERSSIMRKKRQGYVELLQDGLFGLTGPKVQFGFEFDIMSHHTLGGTLTHRGTEINVFEKFLALQEMGKLALSGGMEATQENVSKLIHTVQETGEIGLKWRAKMNESGVVGRAVGSIQSQSLHAAQATRGTSASASQGYALQLPEIGFINEDGVFQFDADASGPEAVVRWRQVRMLSTKALGAGFEDFSSDLQKLQGEVEQLRASLGNFTYEDFTGPFHNKMTGLQRRQYERLMHVSGRLEEVQRQALASDLQKTMGGQLSTRGSNAVASTLPGIRRDEMVLGSRLFERQLASAKEDFVKALIQKDGTVRRGDLIRLQDAITAIAPEVASKLEISSSDDLHGLVRTIADTVMSHQGLRNHFAAGVFQRAGAPFGPEGFHVLDITSDAEFNARNGALELATDANINGAFVHTDLMGSNLGDFDGDSASFGFLEEYTRLKVKHLSGQVLSRTEFGILRRAERGRMFSQASRNVTFARHYTGMYDLFSDRALFIGSDDVLARVTGGDVTLAQDFLYSHRAGLAGAETYGLAKAEIQGILDRYTERESLMTRMATEANEYSGAMQATQKDIAAYVNARTDGKKSVWALVDDYFASKAGVDATKAMGKALSTLTDQRAKAESGAEVEDLTHQQIATFFSLTTYASSTLMAGAFEVAYAMETSSRAIAAQEKAKLYRSVQKHLHASGQGPVRMSELQNELELRRSEDPIIKAAFEAHAAKVEARSRVAGVMLVTQQIAREAIKPKAGNDLLTFARDRLKRVEKVTPSPEAPRGWFGKVMNALFDNPTNPGIEVLGEEAVHPDRLSVSALDIILEQSPRVKGLNWLSRIARGSVLVSRDADPHVYSAAENLHMTVEDRAQMYHEVHETYYDFHKGAAENIWAVGATQKRFQALTGVQLAGFEFFDHAKAADARLMELWGADTEAKVISSDRIAYLRQQVRDGHATHAEKAALAVYDQHSGKGEAALLDAREEALVDKGEYAMAAEFQKQQALAYASQAAWEQAKIAIQEAYASREANDLQKSFRTYAETGVMNSDFNRVDLGAMLKGSHQLFARSHFTSGEAIHRAMTSIFEHWSLEHHEEHTRHGLVVNAAEHLREQAFIHSGENKGYAEMLGNLYESWSQGHRSTDAMIRATFKRKQAEIQDFQANKELYRQQLVDEFQRQAKSAGVAYDAKAMGQESPFQAARMLQDLVDHHGVTLHEDTRKTMLKVAAHEGLDNLRQMANMSHAEMAGQEEKIRSYRNKGLFTDKGLKTLVKHSGKLDALVGAAAGLAILSGGAVYAASDDQFKETLGQMASMLVFSPNAVSARTSSLGRQMSREDFAAYGVVTAASVAAGAGASAYAREAVHRRVYAAAAEGIENFNFSQRQAAANKASIAGTLAGSLGGALVGAAVGILGTAIMQTFGRLRNINPVGEAVAMMTELGSLSSDSGEADIDTLMDGGEEGGQQGIVELRDANGELIMTGELYTYTAAATETGDFDPSQFVEGEADVSLGAMTFDSGGYSAGTSGILGAAGVTGNEDY